MRSLDMAAHHARATLDQIKVETRFHTWTVFAIILALGFTLGAFGHTTSLPGRYRS
jgi:hypothetical protein